MHVPGHVLADGERRRILELPTRLGGIGLRSSGRIAPCAYWASWADCLPVLSARVPGFDAAFRQRMLAHAASPPPANATQALPSLQQAAVLLSGEGFANLPSWESLLQGLQPTPQDPGDFEPGEWRKGWQFQASNARELREHSFLMSALSGSARARLRSSAGRNAARWMTAVPSEDSLRMDDPIFRCAMARRLGLPIAAEADFCDGCGRALDEYGFHRSTCMRTCECSCRDILFSRS